MKNLFLLLLLLFFAVQELAIAATITFTNNCSYTVWPGTMAAGDHVPQLSITGFELPIRASKSVNIPSPWSGRIWGRTGCSHDSGVFVCVTGDCGSGQVECNGAGASLPTTLVELKTASKRGQDLYHVSNVNGFNLPMSIAPKGGLGVCNSSSCPADVISECPEELQERWSDGGVIACKSACLAFNEPKYCCTGDFNTTDKCQPTRYSQIFEEQCPDAYSYAYDNIRLNGSFTCSGRPSYTVTFCPYYHRKTAVQPIGVCYGQDGNNLPSKQEVVDLYKSIGIARMRIYNPDEQILQALKGSNIELILGVPNDRIESVESAASATYWVNRYVKPYASDVKFRYIAVGNEVQPGGGEARSLLSAIESIQNAISAANLQGQIKVSTAIYSGLIANSYPPNNGAFTDREFIKPVVDFLASNGAPLLANIYPYFSYIGNKQSITAEYALFTQQGTNDVGYQNLFDALLDSMYAALEKVGHPDMQIVVSESGWPSEGGDFATVENAGTYYKNLINHVKGGTPKKPNGSIETYLFAMFDENLKKGAEIERNFGLFIPDTSRKYQFSFN